MAIYHMDIKSVSRATGGSATRTAAYNAGERIRDERTGRSYDHSKRQDVLHKEIVLPARFEGEAVAWARDRRTLWNAAEQAGVRVDSRVARQYQVALPAELSKQQQVELVRSFSQNLSERYHCAVDLAIHAPRPHNDVRNYHAHLLATTREITPDGLGGRTAIELNGKERHERGLGRFNQEYLDVRERWASLTNEALRAANVAARVEHRSWQAQGLDREPGPALPKRVYHLERRGVVSEVGERIRAEHATRVQARLERAAAAHAEASPPMSQRQSMEEVRRQARERWERMRQDRTQRDGAGSIPVRYRHTGRDFDL